MQEAVHRHAIAAQSMIGGRDDISRTDAVDDDADRNAALMGAGERIDEKLAGRMARNIARERDAALCLPRMAASISG